MFEEGGGWIECPIEKVGGCGMESVGGGMRPKTEAFLDMVDGLAHGEDEV